MLCKNLKFFQINKKFVLRIDVAAMNKFLNKEVKNASEAKFARWQALFSNFDFDIEHIKGSENCLPDFLSRENLLQTVEKQISNEPASCLIIVSEWKNNQEETREITESMSWTKYKQRWKPTWQL